ncbi:MAG: hypothetical protein PUP92_19965 [Rhizonema sp. PD38]|nr:hypothetical protein [Rhizonema sp. PD38]
MSSEAISVVMKMIDSVPEDLQDRVLEYIKEYLDDLFEELQLDKSFKKTQQQLVAARRAKQDIASGLAIYRYRCHKSLY